MASMPPNGSVVSDQYVLTSFKESNEFLEPIEVYIS